MKSYVQFPPLTDEQYPPFAAFTKNLGFVPNLYRAQSVRTDLIEAELAWARSVMVRESALERRQKEYIALVVSARNLNTYCATSHCEVVRILKIEGPEPEQIAIDHHAAAISLVDKALLNFAVKLNNTPADVCQADIDALRTFGFTDTQIFEAIAMVGVAQFANTVAIGLGTSPDFENPRMNFASR